MAWGAGHMTRGPFTSIKASHSRRHCWHHHPLCLSLIHLTCPVLQAQPAAHTKLSADSCCDSSGPTAAATRPAGRISSSKAMRGKLIVHSQHRGSGSVVVVSGPDKLCLVTALHLGCPLHKALQCIRRKHIQICTTRCTAVACDVANMG